ncbi:MAG: restriction endonuclease subunit S [Clostridia bacterium]|nr:restriction endonuclease subunit S [Clostridia bacterium]
MLELSDRKWAEFKVGNLMTLKVARSNDKGNLEAGTVPFVGRSNDNNGLQGFYDAPNVTQGKCITLGMVGTYRAFWQENDFAASQNILTLRAPWLNKYSALFMCNCIETAIDGKYSYGKSIKAGTFGNTILSLPIDSNGQPDYNFMEQYIAERESQIIVGLQDVLNQMLK